MAGQKKGTGKGEAKTTGKGKAKAKKAPAKKLTKKRRMLEGVARGWPDERILAEAKKAGVTLRAKSIRWIRKHEADRVAEVRKELGLKKNGNGKTKRNGGKKK